MLLWDNLYCTNFLSQETVYAIIALRTMLAIRAHVDPSIWRFARKLIGNTIMGGPSTSALMQKKGKKIVIFIAQPSRREQCVRFHVVRRYRLNTTPHSFLIMDVLRRMFVLKCDAFKLIVVSVETMYLRQRAYVWLILTTLICSMRVEQKLNNLPDVCIRIYCQTSEIFRHLLIKIFQIPICQYNYLKLQYNIL